MIYYRLPLKAPVGRGFWGMRAMARQVKFAALVMAAGVLFAAAPALADVKAGVDAWTAGDYARAVREWADPAARGDPDAQFNMAQAYRLGRGVEIDTEQAEALYAKAAAQGHVKAGDNYGLLLFQDGRRAEAMPYVQAAAGRGDPRAQYLLGIAHFNGDLVAKDWRRAYALLTLANSAGLPQAKAALAQMDEHVPAPDRQAAQVLAQSLKTEADGARARDFAAVDLALAEDAPSGPVVTARIPPQAAPRVAGSAAPASVGADFAGAPRIPAPTARPVIVAAAEPAPTVAPPASPPPKASPAAAAGGKWKVQLGAFGVAGNADRLWSQLAERSELAGKAKLKVASGRLTKLQAGGFATRDAAEAACASLKASGQACLVVN